MGKNIRISERVSNMDQTGMAVVHGQEWTVRTRNDNEIIEPGEEAKNSGNQWCQTYSRKGIGKGGKSYACCNSHCSDHCIGRYCELCEKLFHRRMR